MDEGHLTEVKVTSKNNNLEIFVQVSTLERHQKLIFGIKNACEQDDMHLFQSMSFDQAF